MRPHVIDFGDPWDFGLVYEQLHEFAQAYPFDPDREDYLVHVTTGTHVAQICLFLLTETRLLPGAAAADRAAEAAAGAPSPGSFTIIDLDLSKYDRLAARFRQQQREDLSFLKAGIETRSPVFNDADRADRAGRHRLARAAAADRARPAPASRSSRGASTS